MDVFIGGSVGPRILAVKATVGRHVFHWHLVAYLVDDHRQFVVEHHCFYPAVAAPALERAIHRLVFFAFAHCFTPYADKRY